MQLRRPVQRQLLWVSARQQLQEDLVGERKIPHPAKTLSTSQSHCASSWSEKQGHRMDAQKPQPRRRWQSTRGGHCRKNLQLHTAQALPLLQGGVKECPWCTNLLSSTQVPAAEQHRVGVRGARSALRAIELSPVELPRWPKRQS